MLLIIAFEGSSLTGLGLLDWLAVTTAVPGLLGSTSSVVTVEPAPVFQPSCPCATSRHLASSGVDVYSAVGGGVAALYGPLHGGANEAVLNMLERIQSVDAIPGFLEGVKNRKEKLFGFGHRCGPA